MIKICERTKLKLHVMKKLKSESHCQPWKSHGVKTILENLLNCSLCSVYITVCIQPATTMLNHEAMDSLQTPVSSSSSCSTSHSEVASQHFWVRTALPHGGNTIPATSKETWCFNPSGKPSWGQMNDSPGALWIGESVLGAFIPSIDDSSDAWTQAGTSELSDGWPKSPSSPCGILPGIPSSWELHDFLIDVVRNFPKLSGLLDMKSSKFQKTVKDREAWHAAVHGVANGLSDWTTTTEAGSPQQVNRAAFLLEILGETSFLAFSHF